ncbi:endonuclease-reverse transcriptase [Plakobranchus ocellatus]|uniref:Endonuclease-reverse transcriptase n=1 Tax=Plakobranchus ocellatus TaxID=259542 RepID=A0AAV4D8I2_9GAST|nr:endonuclease-reverse transcriptase [Plakobranchus ocellatus]
MPISLKRQVYDQCVLPTMTYGCQTWSLTKATTQKLRVAQRAMERKIQGIKLTDRVKCSEIRKRTQIQDIVDFVAKQKWRWAGHVARLKDNRWTLRVTEWQPRNDKRSRGRQARRWRDDIVKAKGNTWSRDARDRDEWKRDAEGYILQWMDKSLVGFVDRSSRCQHGGDTSSKNSNIGAIGNNTIATNNNTIAASINTITTGSKTSVKIVTPMPMTVKPMPRVESILLTMWQQRCQSFLCLNFNATAASYNYWCLNLHAVTALTEFLLSALVCGSSSVARALLSVSYTAETVALLEPCCLYLIRQKQ